MNALHDVFDAAGVQAAQILGLWHVFVWTCTAVFTAILLVLIVALWRAPRSSGETPPDLASVDAPEPGPRRSVTTAAIASALGLVALVVASVFTDRALARMSLVDAVNIEVTAHQWWWTARYLNGPVSDSFVTANEIHVPVGKPVIVTLKADDVIHSLWVPSLAGKKDLIPGRTSKMHFRADQAGVYRGQCAEFCGYQHALMGLLVIAQPQAQFDAWAAAQRKPAPEPADARAIRGRDLFLSQSCAMCHAVQGTLANAQRAPDLTHVASRQTLASGTLPNTPSDLAAWIADPQKIKPGTNMPATQLSSEDLAALVAYLGTLK
ncbi:MAG: cytochrome c oxidase, subunit [Ramlibacter sp.]|jgi:cytochrome c oxidase subunit 2|nr:cytochrome c oxidase, subunit [Ramlibacter sp.]